MKKIVLLFILLPFLYLNIGYYPFFLLKQKIIKSEIKQKIKNNILINEIVELVLDKSTYNSLKWMDENEFLYNDHLYDIIKISASKNNGIRIKCIDDIQENSLIAELHKQIQFSKKTTKDQDVNFSELFVLNYLPTKIFTIKNYYELIDYCKSRTKKYKSYIPDLPSPPPKQIA